MWKSKNNWLSDARRQKAIRLLTAPEPISVYVEAGERLTLGQRAFLFFRAKKTFTLGNGTQVYEIRRPDYNDATKLSNLGFKRGRGTSAVEEVFNTPSKDGK